MGRNHSHGEAQALEAEVPAQFYGGCSLLFRKDGKGG